MSRASAPGPLVPPLTGARPHSSMGWSQGVLGRNSNVAIVHSQQTLRSHLHKVLRDEGYTQIQSFADLKAAKEYLEVETLDWVWTPLALDSSINALQFLEMICASPELRNVCMSVFFPEAERDLIPLAFELGMMSWHPHPQSQADVQREVRAALSLLSKHASIPALVACDQLDQLLGSQNATAQRQALFQKVAALYPTSSYAVLGHALREFEADRKGAGLRALKLAQTQNLPGWESLSKKYLGKDFDPQSGNLFDISSYLIVEPDETVHNHVEALMRPFGIKKVHRFTDGEQALKWLAHRNSTDLIIQEWKLPTVGGSNFLQRARHMGVRDVPVLVVSSLLKKNDASLLREMGVACTVQKPLIDHEFVSSLTQTLSEFLEPSSARFVERKIQRLLEMGNIEEAKQEFDKILHPKRSSTGASAQAGDPRTAPQTLLPESSQLYISGLIRYHTRDFTSAKDAFLAALQEGGESLHILNSLARTLIHLRDFKAAARCYEKAQEISPLNVYRLLEMAEAYGELGQTGAVNTSLRKAESLDPTNPELAHLQARMAIKQGNMAQASKIFSGLSEKKTLIADLNNSGVVHIKTGQMEKGIEIYEKALKLIGSGHRDLWIRVTYNLALAQAKSGRALDARRSIERVIGALRSDDLGLAPADREPLKKKSESLHKKLCLHLAENHPLELTTPSPSRPVINESFWNRMEGLSKGAFGEPPALAFRCASDALPGQRCLHLIFKTDKVNTDNTSTRGDRSDPKARDVRDAQATQRVQAVFAHRLTHRPRPAIAKEIPGLPGLSGLSFEGPEEGEGEEWAEIADSEARRAGP